MFKLLKDNSLSSTWQNFFEENFKSEIETIALEYPKKRSLVIDYWALANVCEGSSPKRIR